MPILSSHALPSLPAISVAKETRNLSFWPAKSAGTRSAGCPRPFACSDAERDPKLLRTLLEQWSVNLAGSAVNVLTALHRLSEALILSDEILGLEIWGAGSMVPYVLQYTYQPEQPDDIDPIVYLERQPSLTLEGLGWLVDEAWQSLGGSTQTRFISGATHLKFMIRGDATGDGILQARLTTAAQHIDLRFAFMDAQAKPYDFRCNSVLVGLSDEAPFSILPGLDAGQVMQDIREGVYVFDHRLYGGDIGRLWHIRSRGFVPARLGDEKELNQAFLDWIETHSDAEILGPDLSVRHLIERALNGRSRSKKQALFLNTMAALHQSSLGKHRELILRSLDAFAPTLCPKIAEKHPVTHALFNLLKSPLGASQLALWVTLVADEESGMPQSQDRISEICVAYGPTRDARVARIFLPELRSFVIVRAGDLSDIARLPEQTPQWQPSFFDAPLSHQVALTLGAPSLALLWPKHLKDEPTARLKIASLINAWVSPQLSTALNRRLTESLLMLSAEMPNSLGLSSLDDESPTLKLAQSRWLGEQQTHALKILSDAQQSTEAYVSACETLAHPVIWQTEASESHLLRSNIFTSLPRVLEQHPSLTRGPAKPVRLLIDRLGIENAPSSYLLALAKVWVMNERDKDESFDLRWLEQKSEVLRDAYGASPVLAAQVLAWGRGRPKYLEAIVLLVQAHLGDRATRALTQDYIAIHNERAGLVSPAQELILGLLRARGATHQAEKEALGQLWKTLFAAAHESSNFPKMLSLWSTVTRDATSSSAFWREGLEALLPYWEAGAKSYLTGSTAPCLNLPKTAEDAFADFFDKQSGPRVALASLATLLCDRPIDALHRFEESAMPAFRALTTDARVLVLSTLMTALERQPDIFEIDEADLLFRLFWSADENNTFEGTRWESLGGRLLNLCISSRQYARGINLLLCFEHLPRSGSAHVASAITLLDFLPPSSRVAHAARLLDFATLTFSCNVRADTSIMLVDQSLKLLLDDAVSFTQKIAKTPGWLSFLFYRANARPLMVTDATGQLLTRLFHLLSEEEGLAFAKSLKALCPSLATTSIAHLFVRSGKTARVRQTLALQVLSSLGLYEESDQQEVAFDRAGHQIPEASRAGADCIVALLPALINNREGDPKLALQLWLACVATLCRNNARLLWIDALEKERPSAARPEAVFVFLLMKMKACESAQDQEQLALCALGVLQTLLQSGNREAALGGFLELDSIFEIKREKYLPLFFPLLKGFYEAALELKHKALAILAVIRGVGLAANFWATEGFDAHLSHEDCAFQLVFRGVSEFNMMVGAWLLQHQIANGGVFSLDDPLAQVIARSLHAVPRDVWLDSLPLPVNCDFYTHLRGVTLLRTLARKPPTVKQILAVARAMPPFAQRDPRYLQWIALMKALLQRIAVHSEFKVADSVKNELRDIRLKANPRFRTWLARLEQALAHPPAKHDEGLA